MSQLSLSPLPQPFPKVQPKADRRAMWKTHGEKKDSLGHSSECRLMGMEGGGQVLARTRMQMYSNMFDLWGASAQKAKGGDWFVKWFLCACMFVSDT